MTIAKNRNQMEFLEVKHTRESNDAKYLRAKERIAAVKTFYAKLLRAIALIVFLGAINYYTNQWHYMWFLWAAFGIGLSISFKAIKVFGISPFFGRGWEERKIREFMDEEQNQKRWN